MRGGVRIGLGVRTVVRVGLSRQSRSGLPGISPDHPGRTACSQRIALIAQRASTPTVAHVL